MEIKFKKLYEDSVTPTRGTVDAAGLDLYAHIDDPVFIDSGHYAMIPTGVSCAIPSGYMGGIYARSGLSCKYGLKPRNCVGVVDADYRNEIIVCLYNDGATSGQYIQPGDRIAQLVIQPVLMCDPIVVDSLDETDRGMGGFGSTGK